MPTKIMNNLDVEYMDENLTSSNSMMFNQPADVKERYEQFKALHEKWDVEGFSFGRMQRIWYFRQVCMYSFL